MATDFAAIGRLLAARPRSAMVDALIEGRALAAGDLARIAGVSRPTASAHLAALVDGGLVTVAVTGRHRYFRLAGSEVAEALEALSRICPSTPVRSLRQSGEATRLAAARTCYDHLAGRLGVGLLDALLADRWLRPVDAGWGLTRPGDRHLRDLGVDVDGAQSSRRVFARPCLDWTERRPHLAGALGAAIADLALTDGWVRRLETGRGLLVTPKGQRQLTASPGIDPAALRTGS